jgi:hypothetical protein
VGIDVGPMKLLPLALHNCHIVVILMLRIDSDFATMGTTARRVTGKKGIVRLTACRGMTRCSDLEGKWWGLR